MGLMFKKSKEEDGQKKKTNKKPPEKRIKKKKKPSEAMTCSSQVSLVIAQAQRDARVPAEGLPSPRVGEEAAHSYPLHDLIALEQLSLRKLLVTFTV